MNAAVLQTIISVDLNHVRGNKEGVNSTEAERLGVIHQAVRLSVVKNGDFLHNLTTTLYSGNGTTMGHCLLSFYPFFSSPH